MQYLNVLIFTEMKKEKDLRSKLHSDALKLVLYYFVSYSYKQLPNSKNLVYKLHINQNN